MKVAKSLQDAGFTKSEAEAMIVAFQNVLATKADFHAMGDRFANRCDAMEAEFARQLEAALGKVERNNKRTENSIIKWFVAVLAAHTGLLVGLILFLAG